MTDAHTRKHHWNQAYVTRQPTEVSWFQARPDLSLELIETTGAPLDAAIIDVGGGASTLVDHLLEAGRTSVTVLDISGAALALAQSRLRERAGKVHWIEADLHQWVPPENTFDIWHDRAVLHFLTSPSDQTRYAATLLSTLRHGGWAIIGGFAKGGPTRCSGLEIVQHDSESLGQLFGDNLNLESVRYETHQTPAGNTQKFAFHLFRKQSHCG